jgi:hypothetical protein
MHPGNDYYVNAITHSIQQQSNPLLGHALLAGGYIGPYDWATAQGVISGLKYESGTIPSGTNPLTTLQQAKAGASNPLGGLAAIGDFFNRLTQGNTWLRVGEVAVGLLILYIGLKATVSQTPIGDAAKSATKPIKAVAGVTPPARAFKAERAARSVVAGKKHSASVARKVAKRTS